MQRTAQQIEEHYKVERELADRLRNAPAGQRTQLYGEVYDELIRRVPSHPGLTRKEDPHERQVVVWERMKLLSRFLLPSTIFLEIGAGDCSMTLDAAMRVRYCFAMEVSREIFDRVEPASNMELVLSDGCTIPVPDQIVTVAYSNQVIEHVHPEDAMAQLKSIYQKLAPGGMYLCITPSRLNGPHDVSRYFDLEATGFHMKEYTWGELDRLFRLVGFVRNEAYVGFHHRYVRVPMLLLRALEALLQMVPGRFRRRLSGFPIVRNFLYISVVGIKGSGAKL